MKKNFKVAGLLLSTAFLSGCSLGNGFKGKSFSLESISTTFDTCSEADFFDPDYNTFYTSKENSELMIQILATLFILMARKLLSIK